MYSCFGESLIYESITFPYTGVPLVGLRLVSISMHDCLDWTLIYECTVMGRPGGTIVWTGTAPNCPSDEISLDNWYFTDAEVIFESCNETTVLNNYSVQDNLYTSQLDVTVTHDVAGKTVNAQRHVYL